MSTAPYQYIDSTGVIIPDTSQLLSDVQTELQDVFGADMVVTPDTPQGVLATAEALARTEVVNNNAAVANQINPNIAGGLALDALLAFTGIGRTVQQYTIVPNVTLTGVAGTVIAAGVQSKTAAGDIFTSQSTVTLDITGEALVNFAAVEPGTIPCAIGALHSIVTNGVLGWETVNNTIAGVPGAATQSDQAARALRSNTLAFQAISLPEAITSALYAIPGVTSLKFRENVTGSTQTINGIVMGSHSIYVCVAGGNENDIAAALLENKSSGAGWNGGTTVNVTEPTSGQVYAVKFDIPDQIGILIEVTATNGATENIIQAVLDYANGLINGLKGFVVGASVSPFEISAAIVAEFPEFYIKKVRISFSAGSPAYSTDEILIGVDSQAYTQRSFITVIVAP